MLLSHREFIAGVTYDQSHKDYMIGKCTHCKDKINNFDSSLIGDGNASNALDRKMIKIAKNSTLLEYLEHLKKTSKPYLLHTASKYFDLLRKVSDDNIILLF